MALMAKLQITYSYYYNTRDDVRIDSIHLEGLRRCTDGDGSVVLGIQIVGQGFRLGRPIEGIPMQG